MTAATEGPSGTNGFWLFSGEGYGLYRTRQEILWLSMLGQVAVVGLLVYLISCVAPGSPGVDGIRPLMKELPLIFSGHGGGGGGNFEKTPASHGALPRESLNDQLAPPTVIVPKEMPRLPVEATVMVAPDVPLPHGGQLGDPMSQISSVLSSGPGGPGGLLRWGGTIRGTGLRTGSTRRSSRHGGRHRAATDLQPGAYLLGRGAQIKDAGIGDSNPRGWRGRAHV